MRNFYPGFGVRPGLGFVSHEQRLVVCRFGTQMSDIGGVS